MTSRSGSALPQQWDTGKRSRDERLAAASRYARGKLVSHDDATKLLEAVVRSGDRVCVEGDNQKQADFLARCLTEVDAGVIHDLHIVQSGIVLAKHLDLFEAGIARRLDFCYSAPQGAPRARTLAAGKIELGAIHTYLELF